MATLAELGRIQWEDKVLKNQLWKEVRLLCVRPKVDCNGGIYTIHYNDFYIERVFMHVLPNLSCLFIRIVGYTQVVGGDWFYWVMVHSVLPVPDYLAFRKIRVSSIKLGKLQNHWKSFFWFVLVRNLTICYIRITLVK